MEESAALQAAVAGIVVVVMLIVFGVLSTILNHHWNKYEIEPKRRQRARKIYFSGAGLILALIIVSFIFLLV